MVVALCSLRENQTSLALAKAADCALLCVLLGEMSSPDARSTVSQVGPAHFIGSAVFHLSAKTAAADSARRLR
jgi:hypothetical protein